jgi:asparagine synthase (glutamine-hydrolysing)
VAISGDGGDEMFGGYGRYTHTLREASSVYLWLRWLKHNHRPWRAGRAYVSERLLPMTEETLRTLVERLEPEAERLLAAMRATADGRGPVLHRLRTLDAGHYLPGAVLAKVDRMAMRFALEVRSPLLDVRLARWAGSLPAWACNDGRTSKRIMKRLALRYLPEAIVNRPKQGFGLPDQCWSQDRLLDLADDLLLGPAAQVQGYLDGQKLRRHLARQREPGMFSVYQIWELLVLEQWLRRAARGAMPVAA